MDNEYTEGGSNSMRPCSMKGCIHVAKIGALCISHAEGEAVEQLVHAKHRGASWAWTDEERSEFLSPKSEQPSYNWSYGGVQGSSKNNSADKSSDDEEVEKPEPECEPASGERMSMRQLPDLHMFQSQFMQATNKGEDSSENTKLAVNSRSQMLPMMVYNGDNQLTLHSSGNGVMPMLPAASTPMQSDSKRKQTSIAPAGQTRKLSEKAKSEKAAPRKRVGRERRKCMVEGCTSGSKTRGLCKRHGGGKRCEFSNCPKSAKKGGYCIRHGGGRCKVQGCTSGERRDGMCAFHFRRARHYSILQDHPANVSQSVELTV